MSSTKVPIGAITSVSASDLTREQRADPATPILLEFQSPSAAVLAQVVPARSRYTVWILASMLAVAQLGMVPLNTRSASVLLCSVRVAKPASVMSKVT